jgi:hypothetical protein
MSPQLGYPIKGSIIIAQFAIFLKGIIANKSEKIVTNADI